jgi:cellulose biosynthesis protein BcsQ
VTTLALYSNKGGVGKTTATVNLAYLAARRGAYTLVCDLDPQSSTTYYFRVKPKLKRKARGLAKKGKPIANSIKGTDYEGLDLLPADFTHRNLDLSFAEYKQSTARLRKVLDPLGAEYDLIFLDCPPTINILAENIFNAADYLLVPLMATTLSVRTYDQLLSFFDKQRYNPDIVYAFFSMVDTNRDAHRRLATEVYRQRRRVLKNPIPYFPQLEQMEIRREPVTAFAPDSPAARAYHKLWVEIEQIVLS